LLIISYTKAIAKVKRRASVVGFSPNGNAPKANRRLLREAA